MKILAITSSLTRASRSNQIVRVLQSVQFPKNISIDAADIDLKLYQQDLEASQFQSVRKFRKQLQDSEAIMFVASEMPFGFPYSITAPMLNAISWGALNNNLFEGKSAAFASFDKYPIDSTGSPLHCPNLYHLRQLASILGLNCLKSKFDLQPDKHYSMANREFDDEQTTQVQNTMTNLVQDLVHFHHFEKKKRKHQIPQHFHLVSPEVYGM